MRALLTVEWSDGLSTCWVVDPETSPAHLFPRILPSGVRMISIHLEPTDEEKLGWIPTSILRSMGPEATRLVEE